MLRVQKEDPYFGKGNLESPVVELLLTDENHSAALWLWSYFHWDVQLVSFLHGTPLLHHFSAHLHYHTYLVCPLFPKSLNYW